MLILGIVSWLLCGVAGYLITRWSFRQAGLGWTSEDRFLGFAFGVVGPIFLLATTLIWIQETYFSSDKPAKW